MAIVPVYPRIMQYAPPLMPLYYYPPYYPTVYLPIYPQTYPTVPQPYRYYPATHNPGNFWIWPEGR